jgi:P27 family predicted phage terminase small subunit
MGNRQHRPVNELEPKPPSDKPAPPSWLSDPGPDGRPPLKGYALAEWHRLADTLHAIGTLTAVDQSMFAIYCEAFGRWRVAVDDLDAMAAQDPTTHGVVLRTRDGNMIQNPLVGAVNVLRRDVQRLAVEFGLTPSARTQIQAGAGAADDPIMRKYGLSRA